MSAEKLIQIMKTYDHLIRDLKLVRRLNLPKWCIAAGYVRNYVWDYMHGYSRRTPLNDVDVLYYDLADVTEETEKKYEAVLQGEQPEYNWSCKNQARMHVRNQEQPYGSVSDAMKRWPETATAVGISLDYNMNMEVVAPHGLHDLFDLKIRKSPYFQDKRYFYSRIESKKWLEIWPRLKVSDSE